MNRVIRIHEVGQPHVLRLEDESLGTPGPGQVRLRQAAIGVNFVDIMFRTGVFPVRSLPFVPGVEAAGVVDAIGPGVGNVSVGDRVAYYSVLGAYASERLVDSRALVRLPDDVTFDQAAAIIAKGLTAWMLVKRAHVVKAGEIVLVHAAGGGVGTLVSRWLNALGAHVIAVVGSSGKIDGVRRGGIEHVLSNDGPNLIDAVRNLTAGRGVDVVYDGVGQATLPLSLAVIRDGGVLVRFGSASGSPSADTERAIAARAIEVSSPSLAKYLPDQSQIDQATADVFEAFRAGVFGSPAITRYSLADAAKAHHDLEARLTTGSIILIP